MLQWESIGVIVGLNDLLIGLLFAIKEFFRTLIIGRRFKRNNEASREKVVLQFFMVRLGIYEDVCKLTLAILKCPEYVVQSVTKNLEIR